MRKPYLDNIRWATVCLVIFYHVCYIFNGVGVLGGIPEAENIAAFDTIASIVYPWFMVLLYLIAGVSARYSLQKRTGKQFIRERAVKLLVPSTLGLFVIHWITGYVNISVGGELAAIPVFLRYPIAAISGIGPLWFAQMLFLFSGVAVLLKQLDKADKLWQICEKANIILVLLLFILLWGASQILNAPVLTMYRFGIYLVAFLIGYYLFSHEKVHNAVAKIHIPLLITAIVGAVGYGIYYNGENYTLPECLQSILTNCYLWAAVLAIMGCALRYFNKETAVTKYLSQNSFGFYVLHYLVLIVTCYILHYYSGLSAIGKYLVAFVVGFTGTFVLNEIIKRIPVVRFLVLGQSGHR